MNICCSCFYAVRAQQHRVNSRIQIIIIVARAIGLILGLIILSFERNIFYKKILIVFKLKKNKINCWFIWILKLKKLL
jgi:uncharacterized membrane protein YfcA